MKTSDFIVQFLKEHGIDTVFDYSGGMIVNIEDSLLVSEGIQCFPMRHEQGAGFAAEGYARVSKNFGVALATSGPGATNLITAIGSCYFDSTCALFITGQVNTKDIKMHEKIRQEGFQETDVVSLVKTITKHAHQVLDPTMIKYELEKALYIMKEGRFGPVLLDIPFNIQTADLDFDDQPTFFDSEEYKDMQLDKGENAQVDNLMLAVKDKILAAERPLIVIGNGVLLSKTEKQMKDFASKNNIPVVSSLLGLGLMSENEENFYGFIGTYGSRSANIIAANADLIIGLGTRLDLRQIGNWETFISNKEVVHIDVDEYSQKEDSSNYLFIHLGLNQFFDIVPDIDKREHPKWINFVDSIRTELNHNSEYSDKNFFANRLIQEMSEVAPNNAIVVNDVGQNQMWSAQSWKIKDGQRALYSGGMGAMGFSIPASVGAYMANPDACVVSFCGDGGFQINIQELETIVSNNLPIKIIVFNNNSLGMVREFQDVYFEGRAQSTVIGYSCPDIEKIAKAYGFEYLSIKDDGIAVDYSKVFEQTSPLIVEVKLNKNSQLQPKARYGESIERQYPLLSETLQKRLDTLKEENL